MSAGVLGERFWAKVDRSGECWQWTASTRPGGYPQFAVPVPGARRFRGRHRRMVDAARFAWEVTVGPIAEGMKVRRRCGNRLCCRPSHLFLGVSTRAAEGLVEEVNGALSGVAKNMVDLGSVSDDELSDFTASALDLASVMNEDAGRVTRAGGRS